MSRQNLKTLTRVNVNKKLETAIKYPLVVVAAPAGFGKTTAIVDFFEKGKLDYMWVTMTRPIKIVTNEYVWFLITNAIKERDNELGENLSRRGFPIDSIQITRVINLLKGIEFKDDVVVILDDYYLVETEEINTLIEQIIAANIHKLHIAIITRTIPKIQINELICKGLCYSLDIDDFSFSDSEASDYLKLIDFAGNDKTKEYIITSAGGWATALYLMASNYNRNFNHRENPDININDSVDSLIEDSFFAKYDEEMRQFMLRLSYFENISAAQASYIYDDPLVVGYLKQLCRENAFIKKDNNGNYKIHQVFLDFLIKRREYENTNILPIFNRAGEWFAQRNDYTQAFKYWILASNYQAMFRIMERMDVRKINSIDRKLIIRAFGYTQIVEQHRYPLARLKYIWLSILESRESGRKMLDDFKNYVNQHEHPVYSKNRLLAESAVVETSLAYNNIDAFINCCKEASELFGGEYSYIRNRNSVLTYGSPHFTYAYYNKAGKYKEIVDTIVRDFHYHIEITDGCGMGCQSIALAEYYLETGNYDEVEFYAKKALYEAEAWNQKSIMICARMVLGRYYHLRGQQDKLKRILNCLTEMSNTEEDSIVLNTVDNCLGYLYSIMGESEGIPGWFKDKKKITYNANYQGMGFNYIVYGKAALLQGDFVFLEVLCDTFKRCYSYYNNQLGYIHNYILSAIAKYHVYGRNAGALEMKKAFGIACQDNIVTPFIEELDYIMPILDSPELSQYKKIINVIKKSLEDEVTDSKDPGLLSERETEVIELLENGESQKDIAEILVISPNTVKRHIQNIYKKLDVPNKTLAIAKYREISGKKK